MNKTWIYVIVLVAFLLGLAIGTGLGMQKGQYMLFEGLDEIFNGAEINIDLNETEMVDRMTENFMPLINETIKNYGALDECGLRYENGTIIEINCSEFAKTKDGEGK